MTSAMAASVGLRISWQLIAAVLLIASFAHLPDSTEARRRQSNPLRGPFRGTARNRSTHNHNHHPHYSKYGGHSRAAKVRGNSKAGYQLHRVPDWLGILFTPFDAVPPAKSDLQYAGMAIRLNDRAVLAYDISVLQIYSYCKNVPTEPAFGPQWVPKSFTFPGPLKFNALNPGEGKEQDLWLQSWQLNIQETGIGIYVMMKALNVYQDQVSYKPLYERPRFERDKYQFGYDCQLLSYGQNYIETPGQPEKNSSDLYDSRIDWTGLWSTLMGKESIQESVAEATSWLSDIGRYRQTLQGEPEYRQLVSYKVDTSQRSCNAETGWCDISIIGGRTVNDYSCNGLTDAIAPIVCGPHQIITYIGRPGMNSLLTDCTQKITAQHVAYIYPYLEPHLAAAHTREKRDYRNEELEKKRRRARLRERHNEAWLNWSTTSESTSPNHEPVPDELDTSQTMPIPQNSDDYPSPAEVEGAPLLRQTDEFHSNWPNGGVEIRRPPSWLGIVYGTPLSYPPYRADIFYAGNVIKLNSRTFLGFELSVDGAFGQCPTRTKQTSNLPQQLTIPGPEKFDARDPADGAESDIWVDPVYPYILESGIGLYLIRKIGSENLNEHYEELREEPIFEPSPYEFGSNCHMLSWTEGTLTANLGNRAKHSPRGRGRGKPYKKQLNREMGPTLGNWGSVVGNFAASLLKMEPIDYAVRRSKKFLSELISPGADPFPEPQIRVLTKHNVRPLPETCDKKGRCIIDIEGGRHVNRTNCAGISDAMIPVICNNKITYLGRALATDPAPDCEWKLRVQHVAFVNLSNFQQTIREMYNSFTLSVKV